MRGFHEGAWRGVFLHKNAFGRIMDLGLLVFVLMALGRVGRTWIWWGMAALTIVLILLSKSAGALVVGAVVLALLPFARIMQKSRSAAAPVFIILLMIVGAFFAVTYADFTTVLGVLGKDETLTGRTGLWSATTELARERPVFGYGYDGFWLGWDRSISDHLAPIRLAPDRTPTTG